MHIHILGIGGTFMGSLAQLAQAAGHRVTGCDAHVYPPMSTQLAAAGIEVHNGFDPEQQALNPDIYVVGNVVSRGNPLMEAILDGSLPYTSGPQWLAEHILRGRWVLAVAGTHGKTTTSSMLAWVLESANLAPGYLIGGVPQNFACSARLGGSDFFVIEADEYDTAFFDKRSKFVHYGPRTLVMNNLEYDHADIFPNLEAIEQQFHHLVRSVPRSGLIMYPTQGGLQSVIDKGCWSQSQTLGPGGLWSTALLADDHRRFAVYLADQHVGNVDWGLTGEHNVCNALSAIAAARHVGVPPALACAALSDFVGVKRRMELLADVAGVKVYDDFAHHPTAIASTLAGLRASVGEAPIVAVIEPRSNTMKAGIHKSALLDAVQPANQVLWLQSADTHWSLAAYLEHDESAPEVGHLQHSRVFTRTDDIIAHLLASTPPSGSHIVVMSNGHFEGIHQRLITGLQQEDNE